MSMDKGMGGLKAFLVLGGSLLAYRMVTRGKRAADRVVKPRPSPFVPGSHCTELAHSEQIDRWIAEQVEPLATKAIDDFDLAEDSPYEEILQELVRIVDGIFAATFPECGSTETEAARSLWKLLWCELVLGLVRRGKLDEEEEDVLVLCVDPTFDPRKPPPKDDIMEGEPRIPEPLPVEPRDGAMPPQREEPQSPEPPPNLMHASTRAELTELGLLRLMEGTSNGAPIRAPVRHHVVLGVHPLWPHLERTRVLMAELARGNPQVSFVEVSFADSQRHFGKPEDLGALAWVLSAAGPDGRVFPSPIVADDPWASPPSADEWRKVIDFASGFVGSPTPMRLPRPGRFGDLVRTLASSRKPPKRRARTAPGRSPGRPRRPRR